MAREHTARDDAGHQASVNQARHEPVPASRQDDHPQAAAQRSEDMQRHMEQRRGAALDDRAPALERLSEAVPSNLPTPAPAGDAAQELMGGPGPQGPAPDTPGVQVAAADSQDGRVTRIRAVANAAPGKPDGEVDTRS